MVLVLTDGSRYFCYRDSMFKTHRPEYRIWKGIKRRCFNSHEQNFKFYGGRGITMDQTWKTSFDAFFQHVGPRPSPRHWIDRIDSNGNYEPGNVRWAPRETQANRRDVTFVEYNGAKISPADLCRKKNVSLVLFCQRLANGWDVERAISTPPRARVKLLTYGDVTMSVNDWAKRLGTTRVILTSRIARRRGDHGRAIESLMR